ncbi:MAG: PhnD/SsuA/transferrin family substrate-binding protein [Salaquimonas sp.]
MQLFASLPMYDWPEIRQSTDLYWNFLATSLADHGFAKDRIPASLSRDGDPHAYWLREDMLLSQTCGLPYVRELKDNVTLLGSPAYDLECAAGSYFSVIITHKNNSAASAMDIAGGSFAFNDLRSQSGYAAFFQYLQMRGATRFDGVGVSSGSHLASIKMVAGGKADFAAIDAVSFRLAQRHVEDTEEVQVLAKTSVTPGLPYIASASLNGQKREINSAIRQAIEALPEQAKSDLFLTGFVEREMSDYDVIHDKWIGIAKVGFVSSDAKFKS